MYGEPISRLSVQSTIMDYDELDTYNGDTEHDMWVDFTYHENTGELPDEFADEDLDEYIENLDDWIE